MTVSPFSSRRAYGYMLCGCLCFATMSTFAHEASERTPWQVVAFFRSFLVLLFVGSFAVATKTPLAFARPRRLWFRSICGSFSLVTAFYALAKLPPSTVVTLTNSFPIWIAVLSWPVLGLLPSGRVWVAVVGGVVGVYFIQRPETGGNDLAIGLALISAVFTSLAMIGLHKLKSVNPNAVVVHFSMVATVFAAATFFLFPVRADMAPFYDPVTLAFLFGIGVTASAGQMLLTRAFAIGDPSKVSVVALSQVVFSFLIDTLLFSRHVTMEAFAGTLLILVPTAWVILERRQKTARQKTTETTTPRPETHEPQRVIPCTSANSSSAS